MLSCYIWCIEYFKELEDLRAASQAFIRCVNEPLLCCKGFMGALQQCCAAPCVCVCVCFVRMPWVVAWVFSD